LSILHAGVILNAPRLDFEPLGKREFATPPADNCTFEERKATLMERLKAVASAEEIKLLSESYAQEAALTS
jgi:hypothetical protein